MVYGLGIVCINSGIIYVVKCTPYKGVKLMQVQPHYQFMKDNILKLNTTDNKRVIQDLYEFELNKKINLKDIKYHDSPRGDKAYKLYILGKPILYFDKQHHYPTKKYHCIANFLFLDSVKDVLSCESNMNQ